MNDNILNAMDLPLRDIELPEAISWWPLAPGWWLLLMVVLTLGFLAIYCLRKKTRTKTGVIAAGFTAIRCHRKSIQRTPQYK